MLPNTNTTALSSTKVIDKDGEEIGATTLDSCRTPTEIQGRQTAKMALFRATIVKQVNIGNGLQAELADDSRQTSKRE